MGLARAFERYKMAKSPQLRPWRSLHFKSLWTTASASCTSSGAKNTSMSCPSPRSLQSSFLCLLALQWMSLLAAFKMVFVDQSFAQAL